ncbi:MAG: hypothetical protein IKL27_05120 [Oscillospiraceae bacterium]|nr:hypothetical protein [Oscillospiraceae bacterium]
MKVKKAVIAAEAILLVIILSFLIGTGLRVRSDVIMTDFSISEDGTKLTFQTALPTSMGYIRGFKNDGGIEKPHYLTFYSTFGGLNNSFGAKNEFELALNESDTEIYFNRTDGGYELVLQKDVDTGNWIRPSK